MPEKIKLSYSCTQDWDAMSPSSKGKFCDTCQHEVLDLRALNFEQIKNRLSALDKGVCVKIPEAYAEQEKALEFSVPVELKRLAIAASFVGTLLSIPAQTCEPVQIESASILNTDTVKLNQAPTDSESNMMPALSTENSSTKPAAKSKRRKKLFLNRRFPFVHYGAPYRTLGRTLGCPSF